MIVDCITYINLDYRKDRLKHITNQLYNCNIINFKTKGIVCEDYKNYKAVEYIQNNPTRHKGTIGCFISHLSAINNLIAYGQKKHSKNSYFMVVEDDIDINYEFWNYLRHIKPNPEFDFIFFGSGRKLDNSKCLNIENQLWPIYDDYPIFCGAFCYAISCEKIKKINNILNNIKIYQDFDRFVFTNKLLYNVCYQTNLVKVNNNFLSDRDPTHSWKKKNV